MISFITCCLCLILTSKTKKHPHVDINKEVCKKFERFWCKVTMVAASLATVDAYKCS